MSIKLPYGYSIVSFEQDGSYTPDVGVAMTNPYPTVADKLGVNPATRSTTVFLPDPQPFSALPIIPKSKPAPPTTSMTYYQVSTPPSKLLTPMPVSVSYTIGDADSVAGSQDNTLLWIFGIGIITWLMLRG